MKDYASIATDLRRQVPTMRALVQGLAYETKGILCSEILFMLACLSDEKFERVLESGRARGQSTLLLSLALPDRSIVSVEHEQNSADVAVAEARLRDRANVTLLFGDARKLLPALAREGDVALIDGPKGFRAVRLALRLLASGRVRHVFVHDLTLDTPERAFLDRHLPEARYSDRRELAEISAELDSAIASVIPAERSLRSNAGDLGYGWALGWLPYVPGRSYTWLWVQALIADFAARVTRRRSRDES